VGFRNLTSLVNLDVGNNSLQGNISEVRFLTNIASLHLYGNQFTGEISEGSSLVSVMLSSNQFSGQIPATIGGLKKLNSL
jgi:Leucine-rich repeat (LRR) protein